MKKYLCIGCNNEYDSRTKAENCCGEEAEEINDEETEEDFSEDKTELTE